MLELECRKCRDYVDKKNFFLVFTESLYILAESATSHAA